MELHKGKCSVLAFRKSLVFLLPQIFICLLITARHAKVMHMCLAVYFLYVSRLDLRSGQG